MVSRLLYCSRRIPTPFFSTLGSPAARRRVLYPYDVTNAPVRMSSPNAHECRGSCPRIHRGPSHASLRQVETRFVDLTLRDRGPVHRVHRRPIDHSRPPSTPSSRPSYTDPDVTHSSSRGGYHLHSHPHPPTQPDPFCGTSLGMMSQRWCCDSYTVRAGFIPALRRVSSACWRG
jgi:hypothetical protein